MSRWKKRQMIREINTHTSPIWVPGIQGRKVWKLSFLSFFISDSLFVSLMEFVINLAAGGSIWRVGDNTLPSDPGVRGRKSSILPTPAQHSPSQQNNHTNKKGLRSEHGVWWQRIHGGAVVDSRCHTMHTPMTHANPRADRGTPPVPSRDTTTPSAT